jgi:hypothetical protein
MEAETMKDYFLALLDFVLFAAVLLTMPLWVSFTLFFVVLYTRAANRENKKLY